MGKGDRHYGKWWRNPGHFLKEVVGAANDHVADAGRAVGHAVDAATGREHHFGKPLQEPKQFIDEVGRATGHVVDALTGHEHHFGKLFKQPAHFIEAVVQAGVELHVVPEMTEFGGRASPTGSDDFPSSAAEDPDFDALDEIDWSKIEADVARAMNASPSSFYGGRSVSPAFSVGSEPDQSKDNDNSSCTIS